MSEEPYAPDLVDFLEQENIRRIHYKIEGNKVWKGIICAVYTVSFIKSALTIRSSFHRVENGV